MTDWSQMSEEEREAARERNRRRHDILTRGKVCVAVATVARDYATRGDHDGDLIADAMYALAEALK